MRTAVFTAVGDVIDTRCRGWTMLSVGDVVGRRCRRDNRCRYSTGFRRSCCAHSRLVSRRRAGRFLLSAITVERSEQQVRIYAYDPKEIVIFPTCETLTSAVSPKPSRLYSRLSNLRYEWCAYHTASVLENPLQYNSGTNLNVTHSLQR